MEPRFRKISRKKLEIFLKLTREIELDLSRMDLSGYNLSEVHLVDADFEGCILVDTNFEYSFLKGSIFNNTSSSYANFSDANLEGVFFCDADASFCEFGAAYLNKTRFMRTCLDGAGFEYSNHQDALGLV